MKKKLVIALLCVAAVSVAGGCGKDSSDVSGSVEGAGSDITAVEIEYDVDDYVTLGDYKGVEVTIEDTYKVTEEDLKNAVLDQVVQFPDFQVLDKTTVESGDLINLDYSATVDGEAVDSVSASGRRLELYIPTQKEIKAQVKTDIASYPAYKATDKTTVEDGDVVNIDYEGKKDDVAFDGGTAEGAHLTIGSGSFIDGFEDGLIGVNVGDTVDLNLTFPEDYGNTELAGQDVVFTVTVNSIDEEEKMTYKTLTDEYVSSNFGYDTVDEFLEHEEEVVKSSNTVYLDSVVTDVDGFEEALIGLPVGEETELNLTFPDDYSDSELAGKDAVFNVTVNSIEEAVPMTYEGLTDDYVSSNFSAHSVDDYIQSVRDTLETTAESNKESAVQNAVIAAVMEECTVSGLPDGLLEQKVAEYKAQYEEMCESYGISLETYLTSYYGMTEEQFDEQLDEYMTTELEQEFVFEAIAKAEKLEIDEEGFEEYANNIVANYGYDSVDTLYEQYGKDYVEEAYLFYNVTMDFLVDNAKITYTEPEEADPTTEGETSDTAAPETEGEASDETEAE